jgi:hypothetical protein
MSRQAEHSEDTPGRKPYRSPRLETYGNLQELTRGGNSKEMDDGGKGGPDTKVK